MPAETPARPPRLFPITPKPALDRRFNFGLTHDVAKVLAEHGFGKIANGDDFMRLQTALYTFLYRED
ncbi:hypothetical protein [Actinoplanes sp. NPDC049802]|uniref:hypothetical protein n=1 Tax=Actinoplanes sp. NPDC049802 TaxID=3154742 RepID=UPI0033CDE262